MIYQRYQLQFRQVDPSNLRQRAILQRNILLQDSDSEPEMILDTPPSTPGSPSPLPSSPESPDPSSDEDDDFPTDLPSHWGSIPDPDESYSLPPTPPTIDGPYVLRPSPSVTDPGSSSLIGENWELDFLYDEQENIPPSIDDYPDLDLLSTRRPFREPLTNLSDYLNRRTELDNINEAIANWDSVDFISEVSDWVF